MWVVVLLLFVSCGHNDNNDIVTEIGDMRYQQEQHSKNIKDLNIRIRFLETRDEILEKCKKMACLASKRFDGVRPTTSGEAICVIKEEIYLKGEVENYLRVMYGSSNWSRCYNKGDK